MDFPLWTTPFPLESEVTRPLSIGVNSLDPFPSPWMGLILPEVAILLCSESTRYICYSCGLTNVIMIITDKFMPIMSASCFSLSCLLCTKNMRLTCVLCMSLVMIFLNVHRYKNLCCKILSPNTCMLYNPNTKV